MDYLKVLKAFPMLAKIDDEALSVFAGMLREVRIYTGMNIISEGDDGDEMYFLVEGTVDIIKTTVFGDEFVCATLDADMHAIFGEMALIDKDKRSATVRAKTECMALAIDNKSFDDFSSRFPKAGVELLKFINMNLVRNLRTENENLNMVYQALIEEIESC